MLDEILQRVSSDPVGMRDFAAQQLGGSIVKTHMLTSPSYDPASGQRFVSNTFRHALGIQGAFAPPEEGELW